MNGGEELRIALFTMRSEGLEKVWKTCQDHPFFPNRTTGKLNSNRQAEKIP